MELHRALTDAGLTTFRLSSDFRTGRTELLLERRWAPDLDFAGYGRAFAVDQVPCVEPRALGDAEARALLATAGAGPALATLEDLVRRGRHEMVVLHVHAGLGMRAALAVHSTVLGRNNGRHALRAGGFRRHEPAEPEGDVLVDALNLGRAMSYKNAAAQIPYGGCKMTVQAGPIALTDDARLGFLAWCIDAGHFMTGPDMGFTPEHADALRARFTRHVLGGSKGALGPTGVPTALGCSLAIAEAARLHWGGAGLAGRRAAVQGLGAVGLPLAKHLRDAGMRLVVADLDAGRLERARAELGAVDVVAPEEILSVECDLLSPCALGGILDEAAIDRLRCSMVYGSANNQLRAVTVEEEIRLARRLAARGILYQPDWTHNTAGVIAGAEEYAHQEDARLDRVLPHLERVCRDGTRALLEEARRTGRTPTELATERIDALLYASTRP